MAQFLRTRLLLGKDKFIRLEKARVTVFGLGAVGSYATEALARAGVGSLRLVDFDKIKITNINRQLYALHSTLGRSKAEVAKARVLDINPACKVETFEMFAAQDTIEGLLDNKPDLVVDAIDAFNPKVQLLSYCYKKGIPVISSMGAALRTDPASIKVADIFESHTCPLAYRLRKGLRRQGVGKGILCVYSSQPPQAPGVDADSLNEGDDFIRGRKRLIMGSLPTITGLFGLTIAHCAIEYLSGTGRPERKARK